jgi:hypothetical protein
LPACKPAHGLIFNHVITKKKRSATCRHTAIPDGRQEEEPLKQILQLIPLFPLLLSACTEVQPWERGNLAKPIMSADPSPLQSSLRQHNYASREAAGAASSGAAGGGCGCN